jgi:hypothetical protein
MIKGKSTHETREIFNIQNDFTPEEEQKLRWRMAGPKRGITPTHCREHWELACQQPIMGPMGESSSLARLLRSNGPRRTEKVVRRTNFA